MRRPFDRARGEAPPPERMAELANMLGLELKVLEAPITSEVLRHARMLDLRAPSDAFSSPESSAFVKSGGSLLLILDEERRQPLEKTGVNNFIRPFGMTARFSWRKW